MIKKKSGFTLPELLLAMGMSILVIAAASSVFIALLGQSRTQSKIAQSNESLVGLDILIRDIQSAGYGLTWDNPTPVNYTETAANLFALDDAPNGAPKAIAIQDNVTAYTSPNTMFNGSDYLVIRSVNVARSDASERWSYVGISNVIHLWTSANAAENFQLNDRLIVLNPKGKTSRPLVIGSSGNFYTTYASGGALADSTLAPTDPNDTYLVYDLSTTNLARPFNRADYFISASALDGAPVPSRCAPNTGVLYKAILQQDGSYSYQSLVDCVADFQLIFGMDNDGDGDFQPGVSTDGYSTSLAGLTAQQIRSQVAELKLYILTHEGGRDANYTHAVNPILVGISPTLGRNFDVGSNRNYRWKVYEITVKPFNLLN